MDVYSKIKEKIKNIAGGGKNMLVFTAQVKAVSGETCTVLIDDVEVTDVRLRAVVNGQSSQLLIAPKAGSYVLVVDLSGGDYRSLAVVGYSEIDSVRVEAGGENLFAVLSDFIDEVAKIIVIQGTSPNVPALQAVKNKLHEILK